jgi:predicted TIM-barrel fold metal-dependent hydrolase
VYEGVFQQFPSLTVVQLESGVSWLPSFLWRMVMTWRSLRLEVPWVDRPPAEIVRAHVRLTAQPFDAPPEPDQLLALLEQIGSDEMLLFATDYPHWQFDGDEALPPGLPADIIRKIAVDNPLSCYPRLRDAPS